MDYLSLLTALSHCRLSATMASDAKIIIVFIFFIAVIALVVWAVVSVVRSPKETNSSDEEEEKPFFPPEKEIVVEKKELTDEDIETLKKYKQLLDDGVITQEEYDGIKNKTIGVVVKEKKGIRCPHCGEYNCTIINETTTNGKDYDTSKGCCGFILLGPIGLLCGACGENKEIENTNYWVCNNCGHKWRA